VDRIHRRSLGPTVSALFISGLAAFMMNVGEAAAAGSQVQAPAPVLVAPPGPAPAGETAGLPSAPAAGERAPLILDIGPLHIGPIAGFSAGRTAIEGHRGGAKFSLKIAF